MQQSEERPALRWLIESPTCDTVAPITSTAWPAASPACRPASKTVYSSMFHKSLQMMQSRLTQQSPAPRGYSARVTMRESRTHYDYFLLIFIFHKLDSHACSSCRSSPLTPTNNWGCKTFRTDGHGAVLHLGSGRFCVDLFALE